MYPACFYRVLNIKNTCETLGEFQMWKLHVQLENNKARFGLLNRNLDKSNEKYPLHGHAYHEQITLYSS
jgi:hypothetical protein